MFCFTTVCVLHASLMSEKTEKANGLQSINIDRRWFQYLLLPEVVVEAVPGSELAALVDEHGGGGGAVPRQLLVSWVRGYLQRK